MIQQSIEIGPVHDFLPGMMKLGIGLNGDEIESIDVEFGYLSKNLLATSRNKYFLEAQAKLSRVEPESAPVMDFLFSSCIEEATQTLIPNRAIWIREVVTQVSDLSSALRFLALMSQRMRLDPLTQVILRHREDLLDLVELLTGSRFGYDYILAGGVRFDLSHGFSERLEKWIKNYRDDYARIEAMFYWVHYHGVYLRQIGGVVDTGGLGFVSRATKEETRLGPVSNVKSRLDFMLASTLSVCDKLSTYLSEAVPGEYRVKLVPELKKNHTKNDILTLRGLWEIEINLSAQLEIKEILIQTPSDQTISALSESLLGESIDDLPLIVQSLNFSVAEIDK